MCVCVWYIFKLLFILFKPNKHNHIPDTHFRTVEQLLYLEIKKDAFTKACGLCGYFRKVWTAMPRLETPLRNMLIPTTSCSPWALLTRSFWRRLTNMVMYSIASANSWNASFKKLFSSYYYKNPKTNAHRLMFVALLLRYFSHKCKYQKKSA